MGTCLAEAKLFENSKFGQSLLPTAKGMRFASLRGSNVVSGIATAQLLGSYRMGGTHQSTREESEGRNEGSYSSMALLAPVKW